MNKKKIWKIIFLCLILSGVGLRFYNLRYTTQFNWDQENSLAFPAKDILINHHFPLIGAKTGVGGLYIGPLYSYIVAVFYFLFRMDPVAGAYLAAILSMVTMLTGFFLIKKTFNKITAGYFVLIWSVSTLVITFERIPWNVNLFPLSSLLIFCGLINILKSNKTIGWFLAGIGILFGFSSHFSILLLMATILVFAFLYRKFVNKSVIYVIVFSILGFLPLLLFDLRHNFLLSNNLIGFLGSSAIRTSNIFLHLINITGIVLETIGRIIIYDGLSWIQKSIAILYLMVLFLLRKDKQIWQFFKIFLIYLFTYIFSYTLYSGQTPEYYYAGLLPVAVIGSALILSHFKNKYSLSLFIVIISSIILFRSAMIINRVDFDSLGMKQKIVEMIKHNSRNQAVFINYDMELGWSYGYNYLFDYYDVKMTDNKRDNIYWISYPKVRSSYKPDYVFGNIALSFPNTVKKILNTKNIELYSNLFKLRIPKEWVALQCQGVDLDKYLLTPNLSASCDSYDYEKSGIAIYNLPNCNIWEAEDKVKYQSDSALPLYLIPNKYISSYDNRQNIIATAFERDRCVLFIDPARDTDVLPLTKNILESLKK